MLSAVDALLATSDFALALRHSEFAFENFLCATVGLLPPARGNELLLLDDLLDDGLGRGDIDNGLGARRTRREDAARCTDEKLSFTTGNFAFTHGNVALTGDQDLGTLGIEVAPNASCSFVFSCCRCTARGGGEGKHDGEYGEDQGKDEKECGG